MTKTVGGFSGKKLLPEKIVLALILSRRGRRARGSGQMLSKCR